MTAKGPVAGIGFYGVIAAVCLGGVLSIFLLLPLLQPGIREPDESGSATVNVKADPVELATDRVGHAMSPRRSSALPARGVRVIAVPPGTEFFVDGRSVGIAKPDPECPHQAIPFDLMEISPGEHSFQIRYADARSKMVRRQIKGGMNDEIVLRLWLPNIIIITEGGSAVFGMLEEETDTDLVVSVGLDRRERIRRTDVKRRRDITPVFLRGNHGIQVINRDTDSPELIIDPFPNR